MRVSLAGFLTGRLGGPRNWFAEQPGVCMMSLHRSMPMDAELYRQWTDTMGERSARWRRAGYGLALRDVLDWIPANLTAR